MPYMQPDAGNAFHILKQNAEKGIACFHGCTRDDPHIHDDNHFSRLIVVLTNPVYSHGNSTFDTAHVYGDVYVLSFPLVLNLVCFLIYLDVCINLYLNLHTDKIKCKVLPNFIW